MALEYNIKTPAEVKRVIAPRAYQVWQDMLDLSNIYSHDTGGSAVRESTS